MANAEGKFNGEPVIDLEGLSAIQGTSLFYPCSGNDCLVPISLFSPLVSDFWFADRAYFSPGHQDTRDFGLDVAADRQIPLLSGLADYELKHKTIRGPASWSCHNPEIEPCVLSETYLHLPTGKEIRVHRRRGYGFSAFRKEIRSVGVFFYRGDSEGEGGSGNLWMNSGHVDEICEKLVDGGLIVTDGSQSGGHRYRLLARFSGSRRFPERNAIGETPENFVRKRKSFTDRLGRTFTCIGFAGYRYGPTLVWQVRKSKIIP